MEDQAAVSVGDDLFGNDGEEIGTIVELVSDEKTLRPAWYVVKVGLLKGEHLVPAGQVKIDGDGRATGPEARLAGDGTIRG